MTIVVTSGLIWLVIYSLNYTEAIGFDGPAGGILGLTLFAGWIISAIITVIINRPYSKYSIIDTLMVVFIAGLFTCFLSGFLISQYARSHFSDSITHFQNL